MSKDKRNQIKVDLKNIDTEEILLSYEKGEVPEWEEEYKIRRKVKPKRRLE